ncbi:MAG: hypothetical protein ACRD22_02720 [Terriglobia bacterium]
MNDAFAIVAQKQNVEINAQGTGFQNVWEITYRVTGGPSKGTVGTLSVPEDDHNASYVSQAIQDKITQLDAVASLGKG